MCSGGAFSKSMIALDGHRRPQLPVDKLMNLVAEAGDIELVISLPQINAADIAVRELAQRAAAVVTAVSWAQILC